MQSQLRGFNQLCKQIQGLNIGETQNSNIKGGKLLPRAEFNKMLSDYYKFKCWD